MIPPGGPFMRAGTRFRYAARTMLIAALLGTAMASAHAEERVFTIEIHNDGPTAKPQVLAVSQNDQVVIHVSADKPVQVHLHGYDIESNVVPNVVTSMRFTATATGRFPIEIHSQDPLGQRPLAYLEVRP